MRIEELCHEGIQEWLATSNMDILHEYAITATQQTENATQLRAFLKQFTPFMDTFPKGKKAQALWKKKGEEYFQRWLRENGFFLMQDMKKEDYDLFFFITKSFLQDVRAFDPTFSIDDSGQALRNVWIIAILQRLFNKPVGYHKAMFAYSMLYPYSDNYLDDPSIPIEEKKTFNTWFTKRLKSPHIKGRNTHEQQISKLIQMIEEVFDRKQHAQVFESLLSIQDAQMKSLYQQDGIQPLTTDELLYVSYYKGGTSVVADGYLLDGTLSDAQIRFCMQYGFMLQIGDDLQDRESDHKHAHQTLVSTCEENLDTLFLKLVRYTESILEPSSVCEDDQLLGFVLKDCLFLLFLAMQKLEAHCSKELYEKIQQCLPLTTDAMKEIQEYFNFSYTDDEIWERVDCFIA